MQETHSITETIKLTLVYLTKVHLELNVLLFLC